MNFTGLVNGELRKTFGIPDFDLAVTSTSTGAVTFAIVKEGEGADSEYNGNVRLYGTGNRRIAIEQAGKVRLRATVAETATHEEKSVEVDLVIAKATRLIFFESQTATYSANGYTLLEATVSQGGGAITYGVVQQNTTAYPGQVAISGKQVEITKAGRVRIKATVAEDPNYLSASKEVDLLINKASAIPVLAALDHTYDGTEKEATVSIAPSGLNVSVTYSGSANPPKNAGNYMLVATVLEDNYEGRTSSFFTIHKASQNISITNPGTLKYGATAFPLQATGGGSGNPVVFSIRSGNAFASISNGNILTIRGAGEVTIRATQGASANYEAASPTEETFTITKAPLAVGVENATRIYGEENPPFVLTFSGFVNGDDALDLDMRPTVKPVTSTSATSTSNVGTYDITVSGGTDARYEYATYSKGTLTITKAPQLITLNPITDKKLNDVFTLPATTDAGLTISYTSSNPAVATVVGNVVTVQGLGHTDITATQAGDLNHEAAETKTQTLRVTVTSSPEEIASAKVQVRPNPTADGSITLSGLPQEVLYEVQVLDLTGRKVRQLTTKPYVTGAVQMNVAGLPAGQYILRIKAGDLQLSKRMVKS